MFKGAWAGDWFPWKWKRICVNIEKKQDFGTGLLLIARSREWRLPFLWTNLSNHEHPCSTTYILHVSAFFFMHVQMKTTMIILFFPFFFQWKKLIRTIFKIHFSPSLLPLNFIWQVSKPTFSCAVNKTKEAELEDFRCTYLRCMENKFQRDTDVLSMEHYIWLKFQD